MTLQEDATSTAARNRARTSIWLAIAWLLVAACLGLMSWTLLQLDSADVYILLAPDINAITLGTATAFLAIVPAAAGVHLLVRSAVLRTRQAWAARVVRASGWVAGICIGLVFSYLALMLLLITPVAAYTLHSPTDGRSVLIVNRTVLIAGGFSIYEPREWPTYTAVASLITNNAYDPFRAGTYRAVWTDAGLDLEFVGDYMKPDTYDHKFIEIRR
ncbi:hypothetical protein [Arthrobacter sp. ok362]|uniref:hypothetical protein n=1 Tax=Arthrobacter sp. ok362 TaxID=1761745 RepID=UPI00088EE457|nr:hypothetical protein [Arthrobacter sp. ok362]SDK48085.1 hypothetical protein SAMN04487913_101369 [Arthrobacter sp. ok362]